MRAETAGGNMAIAALILSIVGLVLCWIPFVGWLGVLLALVGLILGLVAFKKGKKGLGIAAMVIGVVGLGWGAYVQIQSIRAASQLASGLDQLNTSLNDPALQQQLNDAMNQAMQPPPAAPAAPAPTPPPAQ
jgi:predicted lipid-binding transport protein (Tim44 family)